VVIWAIVLADSKDIGFPLTLMIIVFDDSASPLRNQILKK